MHTSLMFSAARTEVVGQINRLKYLVAINIKLGTTEGIGNLHVH